jgi:hypothetical protein
MMWLARQKPLAAVAAALFLVTAGVTAQGRQRPAPEREREQAKVVSPSKPAGGPDIAANQALAREQRGLIDEVLGVLQKMVRNGRISPSDPAFAVWGRRKLETLRRSGAGKAEIIGVLEEYIAELKQEEAIAEARRKSARGTQVDVYDARYRRIEAQIVLNEEKAR